MNCDNGVKKFLERFHMEGNIDTVFTCGCCYWFAIILITRFAKESPIMMYDQMANHFGAFINGRVYDITGDVTEKYMWEAWGSLEDESLIKRIEKDCINF